MLFRSFKRRQVVTTTALHAATGLQLPSIARIEPVLTTGTLHLTDRCLDLAIDGEGWFVATAVDGSPRFTRAGAFQVDATSRLVLPSGRPLLPELCVPEDTLDLAIDPKGRVVVRTASRPDETQVLGALLLARFRDPHAQIGRAHV